MDCLSGIDDPRKPSNGTLHDFREILVIAIAAVLSDCDTVEDIAFWARATEAWLRRFAPQECHPVGRDLPADIPSTRSKAVRASVQALGGWHRQRAGRYACGGRQDSVRIGQWWRVGNPHGHRLRDRTGSGAWPGESC